MARETLTPRSRFQGERGWRQSSELQRGFTAETASFCHLLQGSVGERELQTFRTFTIHNERGFGQGQKLVHGGLWCVLSLCNEPYLYIVAQLGCM